MDFCILYYAGYPQKGIPGKAAVGLVCFKHTVTAGWLQKQLYYWFRYCTLLYRKKPQERRKQGVSGKAADR